MSRVASGCPTTRPCSRLGTARRRTTWPRRVPRRRSSWPAAASCGRTWTPAPSRGSTRSPPPASSSPAAWTSSSAAPPPRWAAAAARYTGSSEQEFSRNFRFSCQSPHTRHQTVFSVALFHTIICSAATAARCRCWRPSCTWAASRTWSTDPWPSSPSSTRRTRSTPHHILITSTHAFNKAEALEEALIEYCENCRDFSLRPLISTLSAGGHRQGDRRAAAAAAPGGLDGGRGGQLLRGLHPLQRDRGAVRRRARGRRQEESQRLPRRRSGELQLQVCNFDFNVLIFAIYREGVYQG